MGRILSRRCAVCLFFFFFVLLLCVPPQGSLLLCLSIRTPRSASSLLARARLFSLVVALREQRSLPRTAESGHQHY